MFVICIYVYYVFYVPSYFVVNDLVKGYLKADYSLNITVKNIRDCMFVVLF